MESTCSRRRCCSSSAAVLTALFWLHAGLSIESEAATLDCKGGTAPNAAGTACVACPAGSYADSYAGTKLCIDCGEGRYAPKAGATACSLCPLGSTSSVDFTRCVVCPYAYDAIIGVDVYDVEGAVCEECSDLYPATKPGTCPKGRGRKNCEEDAPCVLCPAGTYSTVSWQKTMDSCRQCPRSTYAAKAGAAACTACPAGKAYLGRGATSAAACNLTYVAGSITVKESITYSGNGTFNDVPFTEKAASVPRQVTLVSGKAVQPKLTFPNGADTGLVDYVLYRLPTGRWLVDLTKADGGTVSCSQAAPAKGPLKLSCVFSTRTLNLGPTSRADWISVLTLQTTASGR